MSMHIAFCLEQQYGHVIPTLGIALELSKRGHRVSYAVIESLAPLVRKVEAHAVIIDPLDTRVETIGAVVLENDCSNYNLSDDAVRKVAALSHARTFHSLAHLREVFRDDMPDVIIHDDIYDTAGRALALEKGLAKIRLQSQFIDHDDPAQPADMFANDEMILVTVPQFFQRKLELFDHDQRFQFVGFVPEGRSLAFERWRPRNRPAQFILVSATTGMGPQIRYCQTMLDAFRGHSWDIVLSISASMDRTSDIDPGWLNHIPANVQLNRSAGNFQVLEGSRLFIGQGGQGATLEAIYWGIPQIVIPPTPYHNRVACRVSELGLGTRLSISELSPDRLIQEVSSLLDDHMTLQRARDAGHSMHSDHAAMHAVDAIESHASGRRH
jgi:UDP:flavonoid glycosyltransferase YjiC (YdhE family)